MSAIDDPCEDYEETEEDADPTPDGDGRIKLEVTDGRDAG